MGAHRIVLAGGGTGGHVYPALAIADALRARGHEVLYYGDPERLEGRVVPGRGLPFRPVRARAWPRRGLLGKLRFALSLGVATLGAARQLRRDRAEAVLGVGGYVSAPPVLAAWLLGLPRAIHEANAVPGLANRLCARVSNLLLLTYESTASRLPGSAPRELVGCPVNPRVLEGEREAALARYGLEPGRPVLLVVGGSLGARRLNELALAAARDPRREYQLLHVTGPRYYEELRAALDPLPPGVALLPYEEHMGEAYAAADLVVCRAGSATLAELTLLGKPSILVPSPNVTENHQERNARDLETAGAALVCTEAELDEERFLGRLRDLLADRAALEVMSRAARRLARPGAAERAAELVEGLLEEKSP